MSSTNAPSRLWKASTITDSGTLRVVQSVAIHRTLLRSCRSLPLFPKEIDGDTCQHDEQTWPGGISSIEQEHDQNRAGCKNVERRNDWVAEGAIRALGVRLLATKQKQARNSKDIKN